MKFGNVIKDLRLNKGLTQREVSEKTGISRSILSQYENNLVEPTATVITKLAIFFEVSPGYLLGTEDEAGGTTVVQLNSQLTNDENELLANFRQLSTYLKGVALSTIRAMAGGSGNTALQNKSKNIK